MSSFLLLLVTGLFFTAGASGGSDDADNEDSASPPETDGGETPVTPKTDLDLGATVTETETGIEIELGADEDRTVMVFHIQDIYEADSDNPPNPKVYFTLAPDTVDFSDTAISGEVGLFPSDGTGSFPSNQQDWTVEDFLNEFDLEVIGTVEPAPDDPPFTDLHRLNVGTIKANGIVEQFDISTTFADGEIARFNVHTPTPDLRIAADENGDTIRQRVAEDTVGTDVNDRYIAEDNGLTIDGAGGNDYLLGFGTLSDLTLLGGDGDDQISGSANPVSNPIAVDGGTGDDRIRIGTGTVNGGDGNDTIHLDYGRAEGGAGNDLLYHRLLNGVGETPINTTIFEGGAGQDKIYVSREGAEGYGGSGDDIVHAYNGAEAHGGAGDDRLFVKKGAKGFGGPGNDVLTTAQTFSSDAPATLTGGEGEDLFRVVLQTEFQPQEVAAIVTDFDPNEDMLAIDSTFEVDSVSIVEDPNGEFTEVTLNWAIERSFGDDEPRSTTVRLMGASGISGDDLIAMDTSGRVAG